MPIEFYCSHCSAYLRAPDTKSGLSTNCPSCHRSVRIPEQSEPAVLSDGNEIWDDGYTTIHEAPQVFSGSRKALRRIVDHCLQCQAPLLEEDRFCGECGFRVGAISLATPEDVDLGRVLSITWSCFTKNLWQCISVTVLDLILTIVITVVAVFIGAITANLGARNPGGMMLMFAAVTAMGWGVAISVFAVGHLSFYLDLCRQEQSDLRKAVQFGGPVASMFLGGVLFWGLAILVFPIIFLWPMGRVIVDQRVSPGRALWFSLKLTARHPGFCVSIFAIKIGAFFVSNLIPFAGIVLVTPYLAMLNTVSYLTLIGEIE